MLEVKLKTSGRVIIKAKGINIKWKQVKLVCTFLFTNSLAIT